MKQLKVVTMALGLTGALGAVAVWATASLASPGSAAPADNPSTQPAKRTAPTVLLTHDGTPFSFERLEGKTVVLNFIFTSCATVCPTQTRALMRVQQALPEDVRERVQFVSVSIDPARDTPDVLTNFAAKLGVDLGNWTFVTGPKQMIRAFSDRYAFRALPDGAEPFDHRTEIRLIDASGRPLQTYKGSPLDEARLTREIQTVDRMFNASTKAQRKLQQQQ